MRLLVVPGQVMRQSIGLCGRLARGGSTAAAVGAVVGVFVVALGAEPAGGTSRPSGGTLTILSPLGDVAFDPALAFSGGHLDISYATCATLTAFRDAPAPAGYTVQPEAEAAAPVVSRDERTYLFTVRKGLRFSDGSPLRARNFARGLARTLDPAMHSVGAEVFWDVRRVSAAGDRLRIVLRQPDGDLPTRMALPWACPVPAGFPIDPAGVPLMVGSGPYYIAQHVPGLLVFGRNPYYRGGLPHRVDRVVVRFQGTLDDDIKAVEDGTADVLGSEIPSDVRKVLAGRYGVDKRQLFRTRGIYTTALVMNISSPLFRNNLPLRKAVNFALDRPGVVAQTQGGLLSNTPTDQIVPSRSQGWVDYQLYPVKEPNLAAARRLAAGHLRGGNAVLYTSPDRNHPAMANEIAADLGKIGLKVDVRQFAAAVMMARVGTPGEPYDMVLGNWGDDLMGPSIPELDPPVLYPDPAQILVRYLSGANARHTSGNANVAYFDVPDYDRRMAAALRLSGPARFRAFSQLDEDIMRNEAPWAPILEGSAWSFVSSHVGCYVPQPVVHLVVGNYCVH